jgi:two-component system response regulator HydG
VLLAGECVEEEDLPPALTSGHAEGAALPDVPPGVTLEDMERRAVTVALEAANGNKSEAARRLGITRKTLHAKLQKYTER